MTQGDPPAAIVPAPCNENEYVLNDVCTDCPTGQSNAAGDIPEDGKTYCDPPYIITQDINVNGEIDCPPNYTHIVNQGDCERFQGNNFHIFRERGVEPPSPSVRIKQDIMDDYESNGFNFFNIRGGRCRANYPVGCWLTNPTTHDQPWTLLHYEECSDPRRPRGVRTHRTAEDFIADDDHESYGVCKR